MGQKTDESMLIEAGKLFPEREKIKWRRTAAHEFDPFTVEELERACRHLKNGKAAGLGGIPNEIIKRVARDQGIHCLKIFNRYLNEGTFPKTWKDGRRQDL